MHLVPHSPGRPGGRLDNLATLVRCTYPQARIGGIEEADSGFPGFRVVLPNGIDVVVGVDIDLPAALFEVVRIQPDDDEATRFHFETFEDDGFAGSGHLSTAAVLTVLHDYASVAMHH